MFAPRKIYGAGPLTSVTDHTVSAPLMSLNAKPERERECEKVKTV